MSQKNKQPLLKRLKILFICTAIFIAIIGSFFIGLFWHAILLYTKNIKPSQLACYGLNNLQETYQVECFSPVSQKQLQFIFKNHLDCKLLTNHQFGHTGTQLGFETTDQPIPIYNNISLIKIDYGNFNLDFDYKHNEIDSSFDPGEPHKNPYVIIQNDDRIVNAIRKSKLTAFFEYEYEYITFSKKTGKGTLVWANTEDREPKKDSFVSEFFQCE